MATAVEPPITMSAIVLSLIHAYGVTVDQLEQSVRENLDKSVPIKRSDDLWNLKVLINGKWFEEQPTRLRI